MLLQYEQFFVTNGVRVASAVRETHVEVSVSSRVGRALCLILKGLGVLVESSVLRVIGHVKMVHPCFLVY